MDVTLLVMFVTLNDINDVVELLGTYTSYIRTH